MKDNVGRTLDTADAASGRQFDLARRCARFQDLCRARGIRVTAQRLAVYRALAEDTTHPTAESIHTLLRGSMSSLSPATVYRVLEFLEKEELVRRVSTTEGVSRFDSKISWHQHLVCRTCGLMMDYEQRSPPRLRLPRRGTGGFVAERYDIRVIGLCRRCRSSPPAKRRQGRRRAPKP